MRTLIAQTRRLLNSSYSTTKDSRLTLLTLLWRLAPSEQQRIFILTLLTGVFCGLAAVAFHLAIRAAENLLIHRAINAPAPAWIWWTLFLPAAGALVSGLLLYYVWPDARGSGIPQVKVAYAVKGGRMPFRVSVGKFILGTIQIGSGASLGREGPTVQICAGIASTLGRLAALPRGRQRQLLPIGAAAGIAAAFNAPIAAVTFVVEELIGNLDHTVLAGVIVAAAIAAAIERVILGEHPIFTIPSGYGLHHAESLLLYALLGCAGAVVSLLFTESLLGLRARFQRMRLMPPWARPAIGGIVTGALAVVAMLWLQTEGVAGGGYEVLLSALEGQLTFKIMIALCFLKIAATVFCYSSGGAGGIFAPSLFIGAMLGGSIGFLDVALFHHDASEIGAFALVGMGTAFAGIIRAPITSVLIIFEMTGGYGLILPLMIANMTAYALVRQVRPLPIYEALLAQDGVHLPHRHGPVSHALEQIRVDEAMTRKPVTLSADMTVSAALTEIAPYHFASYPVLDAMGHLVGLVSEARLRRTLAEKGGDIRVGTVADRREPLFTDQRLDEAVLAMGENDSRELAVVERETPQRLVGILALSDIVRAHARLVHTLTGSPEMPHTFSEVEETLADQPLFRRMRRFGTDGHLIPARNGEKAEDGSEELQYYTVLLRPDAPAAGQPIRSLNLPRGVLIIMIERNKQAVIPQGATILAPGDHVILLAPPEQLAASLQTLTGTATIATSKDKEISQ